MRLLTKLQIALPCFWACTLFASCMSTRAFAADGLAALLEEANASAPVVAATADGPTQRRLPRPTAAAARQSAVKVGEIFSADAKEANSPEKKSALAIGLLQHAADTTDATDRYVLLDAAKSLATAAGDVDACFRAIAELARLYEVDGDALQMAALEVMATKSPGAAVPEVATALLRVAERHKNRRDLKTAEEAAQLAATAARRGKDRDLQKAVLEELADIRDCKKAAAKVQPLLDRLAADPSDREAALEIGRFRCFVEDDWAAGLPFLARGSDEDLARLAKGELSQPESAASRVQLADAWWAYASSHKGPDGAAAEARARIHYAGALGDLDGLEKARVQKRLKTSLAGGKSLSKRPRNLVLWLDASAPGAIRGPNGQPFDRAAGAKMPVSAWVDHGSNVTLTVGAGSKPPAIEATALDGLPGVVFTGEERLMGPFSMPQSGSIAVVLQVATIADMRPLGCMEKDPGIRLSIRPDGGMWLEFAKNFAGGPTARAPKDSVEAGEPLVVTGFWSDSVGLRMNGSQFVSPANPAPNVSSGQALVLGAMTEQGTYSFKGILAEVRIYSEVLSPAAFAMLETDLRRKWSARK
jgi:hypothetical protein